jgi:2-haloacid dehalogenase
MPTTQPPTVLFFDVFGTVVDWRSSIHRALTTRVRAALADDAPRPLPQLIRDNASSLTDDDWHVFAQQWRDSYGTFTRSYNPATQKEFISVDQHHLDSLRDLLRQWHLEGLFSEEETRELSLAWHYLDPWPDSTEGLRRLNTRFQTSTLSNGNTSLLSDLAEHGPLPFTHITSAEEFKAYKPAPEVYNGAALKFGLEPAQCALVAAHLSDLKAAKARGYGAIYVERRQEERYTDEQTAQAKQEGWVDEWVTLGEDGFREVAKRLGV